MASHDSVAEKFGKRQVNTRTKRVEWSASRVYCYDDLIYSYGGHFPMAKFLGEHPKHGNFFIKNSDKYSSSTALTSRVFAPTASARKCPGRV